MAKYMYLIALASPFLFLVASFYATIQNGSRPKHLITLSKIFSGISLVSAALSAYLVYANGLIESNLIGFKGLGFSIRLDSISIIMFSMISLLAFIIIKYSINYMDGDDKQGSFIGRLCATIAAVQLLVISGNLGVLLVSWVLTSMALNRLLLFYPDRAGAFFAAKKKFILARLGDICLLVSASILFHEFGTGNLEFIFNQIQQTNVSMDNQLEWSAIFLAFAAILKSAQFPTHGWLIEVMETPTPVSSLLHAGLLNAGPFLIIRMAYLIEFSNIAPILLIGIGGLTAILASVSYLTQTSVKTALGYSSIGHMGFSLMVSGLGLFPAAMLHLVAHSFYKAHAFLSSGSVIDRLKIAKAFRMQRKDSFIKLIISLISATTIYAFIAYLWGFKLTKDYALLLIGLVIVMGMARIIAAAIGQELNSRLVISSILISAMLSGLFFGLETTMMALIGSSAPINQSLSISKIVLLGSLILISLLTISIQIIAGSLVQNEAILKLAIYFRNGFYMNAWFDKFVGSYKNFETIEKDPIVYSIPQKAYKKIKEQFA